MNIYSTLKHLPVAWLLALAPAAAAAAAPTPPPPPITANSVSCSAPAYQGKVREVQYYLNRIYQNNGQFKTAAGSRPNPLDDGVMGKVTQEWLGKFCATHPFQASAANFEAEVLARLASVDKASVATPPAPPATRAAGVVPPNTRYIYNPKALRKAKEIEAMAPRLLLLKERYADRKQFTDAVSRIVPRQQIDAETMAQITRYSTLDGYMLSARMIGQLKGASAGLRTRLAASADIGHDSAEAMHVALRAVAPDDPERTELNGLIGQIDQLARRADYQIPPTIATDLAPAADLDPAILNLYEPMANVAYPSAQLFLLAMQARLERALGMCPHDRFLHEGRLDDAQLAALMVLVEGSIQPGEVSQLRQINSRCSPREAKRARALAEQAHLVLFGKLRKSAFLVMQSLPPALEQQGGVGAVAGCGCAPDAADDTSYGFYPLWTHPEQRQIDFDVLSRIGLYGVTVNDEGGLDLPEGVTSLPWKLLESAHRHLSKVDWVVSKNTWPTPESGLLPGFLASLRRNIDAWLRKAPPSLDWRGTALATFGLEQGPTAGDGITLRFENFPAGAGEQAALHDFVQKLSADLHAMKPARQLFLMVDQDDIIEPSSSGENSPVHSEQRPFSAINLHKMMQQVNEIDYTVQPGSSKLGRANDLRLLVMVREPTFIETLKLRTDIENSLFSDERVRVLRNIIPVLEYDGVRAGALQDDILYFQDNFGGIGFWPLPFVGTNDEDQGSTSAISLLHRFYGRRGADGNATSEIFDLICPNRAWMRWLAWFSAMTAIAAGVTLVRCHGCGTRLDNNKWYMAGMIVLIAFPFVVISALVAGDPLFKSGSGVHWVVAAILLAVVIIPGIYGLLKPKTQLP